MRIRKRDGTIVEVGAGYILEDGEALAGGDFRFMDSAQRAVLDEQRIRDAEEASAACAQAFHEAWHHREAWRQEHIDALTSAWRRDPPSPSPGQAPAPTPSISVPTADDIAAGQAAVAAAYQEHSDWLTNAWRRT
jgi:hypothetical protein